MLSFLVHSFPSNAHASEGIQFIFDQHLRSILRHSHHLKED